MLPRVILPFGLLLVSLFWMATGSGLSQAKKGEAKKPPPSLKPVDDLNELNLEVEALRALHELEFTPTQLRALFPIAQACAEKPRKRDAVKASPAFRQALQNLHDALVVGDDERIDTLEEKLDELLDKKAPEFDEDFEITDAARKKSADVVKLLGLKQLVAFVTNQSDSLADPRHAIEEALDEGKDMKGDDWNDHRDQVAEDVAKVVAGLDAAKAKKVKDSFAGLLDRWHKKDAVDPDALDKEVRALIGAIPATTLLQRALEVHMARIVSNPQAPAAIRARLDAMAAEAATK